MTRGRPAAVVFDLDTVLADFYAAYNELAKSMKNPCPVPVSDYWRWDSRPASSAVWSAIAESKSFWYEMDPLCTVAEAERIANMVGNSDRHVIPYFVTGRGLGKNLYAQTRHWLRYTLGVQHAQLIFSARKGDTCAAIGATHCIDDKAGNAVYTHYVTHGMTVSCILDNPGNRFDPSVIGSGVKRMKTVTEYLDRVAYDLEIAV